MTGFCAILGAPQPSGGDSAARVLLAGIRDRGADQSAVWAGEGGMVGVCRPAWELDPDFAGDVLVLEQEQLVVAADASLYYRDDLRRALRQAGELPTGDTPSHLIAAAYRAWGAEGVSALEGDFAFLVWDRTRRELLAARDPAGSRGLYYALAGEQLILASTMTAVAAHPAISRELNRVVLAEGMIAASSTVLHETPFRAISRVPAGFTLRWQPGQAPRLQRFWEPPLFGQDGGAGPEDAAEQLRAVLRDAIRERMATSGPTSVWMSGGFDSPAVFAIAHQTGRGTPIPVSMSYPPGDPGREDELIQAIADRYNTRVHWVPIDSVPPMGDPAQSAIGRDEPCAHPYEQWNRALARGSRANGARIALTGNGGDQFFGGSAFFLTDLLRAGRLRRLFRELRFIGAGVGLAYLRGLFQWTIQPLLPEPLHRAAAWLRGGRRLRPHLQASIPHWFATDVVSEAVLRSRQWSYASRRPGESFASAEAVWYLTTSFGPRIINTLTPLARSEGVETRSPMYDRRVIEFIARRPQEDRVGEGEKKRLLRRSVAALLPEGHVAERRTRTGLPSTYLRRNLTALLPEWLRALEGDLRVAELGLVDPKALRGSLERYLNSGWDSRLGAQVMDVLMTEHWIRAHADRSTGLAVLVA